MSHKKGEERTCLNCGKQFWIFNSRLPSKKVYCSQSCRIEHSGKKAICICKTCGKEFKEWTYRIQKYGGGKYCSQKCAGVGTYSSKINLHEKTSHEKISKAKKEYYKNPENLEKMKTRLKGKKRTKEQCEKQSIRTKEYWKTHPHPSIGRPPSEETKMKISETKKKLYEMKRPSESERAKRKQEKNILRNKRRKKSYESQKLKLIELRKQNKHAARLSKLGKKNPNYGKKLSELTLEKRTISCKETEVGGFWYGNVKYYTRIEKEYCELWKPELCERIRAAWNYKSAISGKTKEDNKGKALSCHHVYYQTKACCEWDEDMHGYYAMINLGTKKKPDMYKHYINGSPNKFVPLTRGEHSATNHNKLFWILYFEEIIARKSGKCYLTKDEMKKYNTFI